MAELVLVAAAALIDRDGRVLLAQRDRGPEAGQWEFPGGKLEPGETPEEALVRELREELDLETDASCLAPIAFASQPCGERHLLMPVFACRKWRGAARAKEHRALVWSRPEDLLAHDLSPADKPVAAQLRDWLCV